MITSRVAQVFAAQWPVLVATLRRDLGDLDLAEESAQDAFVEAAAHGGAGDAHHAVRQAGVVADVAHIGLERIAAGIDEGLDQTVERMAFLGQPPD